MDKSPTHPDRLMAFFVALDGFNLLSIDRNEARFLCHDDAWFDAHWAAVEAFGRDFVNSRYWRVVETSDGANLIVRRA